MRATKKRALTFAVGLGLVLAAPALDTSSGRSWQWGIPPARAAASGVEKEAFDAAKELGTVEAWDAFLSHYPQGLYADLARAYLKKMASEPAAGAPPPPAAAAPATYPMPAGSWGGVVRDGPGQSYGKVDSLQEGDTVTLVERTDVMENNFPWFKITYSGGGSGYQWGGILCAIGKERPDLFKTCTTAAERDEARASAPNKCRENGGEWGDGQCWPKGHFSQQEQMKKAPRERSGKTPVNKTGLSCKELKARCSRTDSDNDCKRYLSSCTGHGDN
jgi:hypothetical protein